VAMRVLKKAALFELLNLSGVVKNAPLCAEIMCC
jgi:hypothetical protein